MEEYKYIISLVYEKPIQQEDGSFVITNEYVINKYENEKSANADYKKFNTKYFINCPTPFGSIAFKLISVELVNIQQLELYELAKNNQSKLQETDEKILEEVSNHE